MQLPQQAKPKPITYKAARAIMGCNQLISEREANPKVKKQEQESGIHTAILHLAPAALSGHNVCAHASPGCTEACLHTSGNPVHFAQKNKARIEKTRAFFNERKLFLGILERELFARLSWCDKQGLRMAARLNGTSDINWDMVADSMLYRLDRAGVVMYDYTKDPRQATQDSVRHIAYSRSEINHNRAIKMLNLGVSVAVVVAGCGTSAHPKPLPRTMWKFNTVDGDPHDRIFEHPRGSVILLRAKGDAKKDTSGFVVDQWGEPVRQLTQLTISAA